MQESVIKQDTKTWALEKATRRDTNKSSSIKIIFWYEVVSPIEEKLYKNINLHLHVIFTETEEGQKSG